MTYKPINPHEYSAGEIALDTDPRLKFQAISEGPDLPVKTIVERQKRQEGNK